MIEVTRICPEPVVALPGAVVVYTPSNPDPVILNIRNFEDMPFGLTTNG